MADNVPVPLPTTGVSTAIIGCDEVGTGSTAVQYQQVKLMGGQLGGTEPIPGGSAFGLVVDVSRIVGVSISTMPAVSGTVTVLGSVSVSGSALVSGTVTVNTAPTVAGASVTIQQGASVSAVVSGTVNVATVATVLTIVTQLGTQVVSVVPGVSVTVQQGASVSAVVSGTVNVATVVTVLSTVNVAIVAGAGGGGSVTTAVPSISATGQVMWLAGGQSTTATPVYVSQINPPAGGGGSVTTAVPSISATGQIMWIVGGQSTTAFPVVVTGTVSAGAGTTVVSLQSIVPVTTAASVSVSGLPVWLNPTQQVVVSGFAGQSVSAVVSGTVTVNTAATVNGASVTIQQGASVSAVVSGTVSVLNVAPVTTAASVSVTGLPVWFNPTAAIGTVATILTTVNVAIVAGAGGGGSVTTAVPSISATGQVMWLAGGQSTSAFPVYVSQINPPAGGGGSVTTAVPSISATGQIMWIVGGQSTTANPVVITGTVAPVDRTTAAPSTSATGGIVWLAGVKQADVTTSAAGAGATGMVVYPALASGTTVPTSGVTAIQVWPGTPTYVPVLIQVTSTAGISAGTVYLMTIWTGGTRAAAGTTAYPVPGGLTLRLNAILLAGNSATNVGTLQAMVIAATATASIVSAAVPTAGHPMMAQLSFSSAVNAPQQVQLMGIYADIPAATTIGVFITMGTSVSQIQAVLIQGYLF